MVEELDRQARLFADQSARHMGKDTSQQPGAGAAGGLGYAFMQYLSASVCSGADLLLNLIRFDELLKDTDLVITGEGHADSQTLMGKLPERVMRRAQKYQVPVWLVAGQTDDAEKLITAGFTRADKLTPEGLALHEAINQKLPDKIYIAGSAKTSKEISIRTFTFIMKTTHLLYTSAFLAMTPLAVFPQGNQSRPNLVFIMADQFRGDALGCMQKEPVQTPNLDKLAEEGILFTEAISSYPVSSPARAMLMTGMYPTANGVTGNCNSDNTPYRVELSAEAICWSDVLKQAGYSTAYIGKWHLDAPHPPYIDTYNNRGKVAWNEWCSPERRHGFDQWIAYGTYDNHLKPMYWDTEASREDFYYVDQWGPSYEADRAIEFIHKESSQSDQPFALVVSMNPPHTGYELVPDSFKQRYAHIDVEALASQKPYIPAKGTPEGDYFRTHIRNYYACITGVDENIGRIIRTLKECGVFDNTLIIFSSDHGICMGGHGIEGKNVSTKNPCESR